MYQELTIQSPGCIKLCFDSITRHCCPLVWPLRCVLVSGYHTQFLINKVTKWLLIKCLNLYLSLCDKDVLSKAAEEKLIFILIKYFLVFQPQDTCLVHCTLVTLYFKILIYELNSWIQSKKGTFILLPCISCYYWCRSLSTSFLTPLPVQLSWLCPCCQKENCVLTLWDNGRDTVIT